MTHSTNRIFATVAFALMVLAAGAYTAPVASAGADQSANVGQNVTVSGAASTCSGCSITSYSWNWGNGNTSTGVSATHAYNASGSYTVTLTVVANDSSISSDTLTATVQSSDATAPTITHTNVTNWTSNQSITITSTVTDNVGVSSVTLYYKNASAGSFSSSSMSASGSTYTGSIPNTSTSESYALYYISATDGVNTATHGSNSAPVNVTLSSTDVIAPITSLVSVSGDTSSPYWVTTSNSTSNNAWVMLSGESGMSCRMGASNSNYSGMTVSYVDCTISGSTANCTSTLADSNYTRFVACKDSNNVEQNTSQTLNVTFSVDSTAPSTVSTLTATEGTSRITLAWTAATDSGSGVSVQKIFRSADSTTNYSSIQSAYNATGIGYNDTSLTSGVTYRYYVVGQDVAGNLGAAPSSISGIYYGAPLVTAISLTLSGSTLTLAATTNENSSCRYGTSSANYSSMTSNFTTTGATSHSTTGSGSSGTVTYYVSCADTAGNNMTTANSTSYTFAAATTTTTTSSGGNSGGGSVAGGAPSGSTSDAQAFSVGSESSPTTVSSQHSVSYSSASGVSTFTLKVENTGASPTGPIVLKSEIPSRVAASPEDIVFSIPPTRFESGSIIAVWELEGGIGSGESLTITYSVKKQISTLTDFKTTVSNLVAASPAQPSAGTSGQPPTGQPSVQPQPSGTRAGATGQPSGEEQPPAAGAPSTGDALGGLVAIVTIVVLVAVIAIAGYALFGRKRKGL